MYFGFRRQSGSTVLAGLQPDTAVEIEARGWTLICLLMRREIYMHFTNPSDSAFPDSEFLALSIAPYPRDAFLRYITTGYAEFPTVKPG